MAGHVELFAVLLDGLIPAMPQRIWCGQAFSALLFVFRVLGQICLFAVAIGRLGESSECCQSEGNPSDRQFLS